ncbi:MAG: hypothetical protein ACLP0J_05410 [Solirubrobacteraceae bacterium]
MTVNGLDAIAALPAPANGRVVWDLDWERSEASDGRVRKLSVTDTGTGMTAAQLRRYINQLAASGREQSGTGNFGVGAKVAAGSRNPHGLEYRSWHQGHGALVRFMRHPDGRWGLQPQPWADGHVDFWRELKEHDKPWLLRGQDHGTQVVLLGQNERHDTTQAPTSVSEARQHWITRYLNSRFRQFPEQVEVLVREHHDRREAGQLRRIHGERHYIEQHAVAGGVVKLSDAIVHWWVLDDDPHVRRREAGIWASSGHAAAVLGDELYDTLPQTRGGYARLQDFGIRFACERIVLHLEPQVQEGRLQANTARTMLLLDHEPLPWSRWGEEFAAAMPEELMRLQERVASNDGIPREEAIRNRVSAILPLYRLSRYPARHELTINADFRAINDLTAHWRDLYKGVPGANSVIEAQVREWCEQVLVEVVLAARNSSWSEGQLDALLSPTSFTAALLPRHLLHAMLQKRLVQKLGSPGTGTASTDARGYHNKPRSPDRTGTKARRGVR